MHVFLCVFNLIHADADKWFKVNVAGVLEVAPQDLRIQNHREIGLSIAMFDDRMVHEVFIHLWVVSGFRGQSMIYIDILSSHCWLEVITILISTDMSVIPNSSPMWSQVKIKIEHPRIEDFEINNQKIRNHYIASCS